MDEKHRLASEIRDKFDEILYYGKELSKLTPEDMKKFRDYLTNLFPQKPSLPLGVNAGDFAPTRDVFGG